MKQRLNTTLARLFSIDLLLALALCIAASAVFGFIAREIVWEKKGVFDADVFNAFSRFTSPLHTKIALAITFFGSSGFLLPVYIAIIIYLARSKKKAYAVMVGAVALVSMLLGFLLKALFQRQRPLLAHLTEAGGYSFPSGHSTGASTLALILIYLLWKTGHGWYRKWLLSLGLLLYAGLVGASRVYLHVHFASDVIGGFCVTIAWLSLFFIGMELVNSSRSQ